MSEHHNDSNAVGAYFLGPHAENSDQFSKFINVVLTAHFKGRRAYFPDDPSPIPAEMKVSKEYKGKITKLTTLLECMLPELAKHSVPLSSPRYLGHMNGDTSIPGIIGYFATMLLNPNNACLESSPLTTGIEIEVGLQLCKMVGFKRNRKDDGSGDDDYDYGDDHDDHDHDSDDDDTVPVGWGHITSGGTVANLESMWAARNLKYYPLSLRNAMKKEFSGIAKTFCVPTCQGPTKLFADFTLWELLNIAPDDVLNLPVRLMSQYGISSSSIEKIMALYLVQTVGMHHIQKEFSIALPPLYFASAVKHYSWPKSAALTGIGSENVISVNVDNEARMDVADLRKRLDECLDQKRAVYAVVAIIGSTEHGSCDPLGDIVALREEYRAKGLSFVLHADAAWGAYFATTFTSFSPRSARTAFIPDICLKPKTRESLSHLRFCDSVTADPHKSGYVQYPAGALLYRNSRMRYLVTWTAPIVAKSDEGDNIGIYGVEGSKAGASPVAVYFSHEVIGLNTRGYGQLLRQATFGAVMMYAHIATLSDANSTFIAVPLNALKDDEQKARVKELLVGKTNQQIAASSDAMELATEIGSDLSVNAFSVNFMLNGKPNTDVGEANHLVERVYRRLSMALPEDDMTKKPLFLTSTRLSQSSYGSCLTNFKKRLHLSEGPEDLNILVNSVMSPFPTTVDLMTSITQSLRQTIEEESRVLVFRNTPFPDHHGFAIQGTDTLFFVHFAMFNLENHRVQLVITGELAPAVVAQLALLRQTNPGQVYVLGTQERASLADMIAHKKFPADIYKGVPDMGATPVIPDVELTNIRVISQRFLQRRDLTSYPDRFPFIVYGTAQQHHIDHVYTASPNIQVCADRVTISGYTPPADKVVYAHLTKVFSERDMQPFGPEDVLLKPGDVFESVEFTEDLAGSMILGTGTLTISGDIFEDTSILNRNPELPNKGLSDGFFSTSQGVRRGSVMDDIKEKVRRARTVAETESPPVNVRKGFFEYFWGPAAPAAKVSGG